MGKFTEYKIPLASLQQGVHSYQFHLGKQFFENMENADIHDADLTVDLTITHKGELYNLDFKVVGTITLICDRCLDSLVRDVDTTYNIAVKYGDDYNDDNDDLLVIPRSDNFLNVAYMIHDTVALTIPIKHVHPAGKCNRQMSAILKKHRATTGGDDEEAELENTLIEEMDTMESVEPEESATDPRWDALKNIGQTNEEN